MTGDRKFLERKFAAKWKSLYRFKHKSETAASNAIVSLRDIDTLLEGMFNPVKAPWSES